MSPDPFSRPLEGCDAIQFQISEAADGGAPLSVDVQDHLPGCVDCARFAEIWLAGPPAVLAAPVPVATAEGNATLRELILDARAATNVVRFQQPAARPARSAAAVWFGQIAACAVFAGFAYWLLNPMLSPVGQERSRIAAGPSVARTVARLEDQRRAEGEILHSAVIQGGSRVQHAASWSMSSLEL